MEGVRSAANAPLSSDPNTPDRKWSIGDALLEVPEEYRDHVAESAGLKANNARSYARVSEAWPPTTRHIACAWSVYRTLAKSPERFNKIRPGMTLRQAIKLQTGRDIDRQPVHLVVKREGIDGLADDLVKTLLSRHATELVPTLIERLNASKEGRRRLVARRSAKVIRELDNEIRKISSEINRMRGEGGPDLVFMDRQSKFLKNQAATEEIALMYQDTPIRDAIPIEKWERLADLLDQHARRAAEIAATLRSDSDIIEVDWSEEVPMATMQLGGGRWNETEIVDAEIVDAEIVDE